MNDTFAGSVEAWHDFYLFVGTAASTLVGLLFVALTLRPNVLKRDEFGASRALATQSFACFLNLLTIAGVMLIPQPTYAGVGIPLVCIGGISLLLTLRSMIIKRHQAEWRMLRRTGLMLIGMGAVFGIGIALWSGQGSMLIWLTVAVLTLLSAASNNAWSLLIDG